MNEVEAIRTAHKLGPRKYNFKVNSQEEMRIYHEEVGLLLRRIDDLEANNRILADRLIQQSHQLGIYEQGFAPDGFWIAPNEPDGVMQAVGAGEIRIDTTIINKLFTAIRVYKAMRENYLARSES